MKGVYETFRHRHETMARLAEEASRSHDSISSPRVTAQDIVRLTRISFCLRELRIEKYVTPSTIAATMRPMLRASNFMTFTSCSTGDRSRVRLISGVQNPRGRGPAESWPERG